MSHKHKIILTPGQRLERALSMLNRGVYKLGKGGRNPEAPTPFWKDDKLKSEYADCSGFANWVAGYDRYQPCTELEAPEDLWDEGNEGFWMDTSGIVADAERNEGAIWWRKVPRREAVQPGDFVVYADKDGHQGHIAMVAQLLEGFNAYRRKGAGWGKRVEIIDCSPRARNGYFGALDRKTYVRKFAVQYRPDRAQVFERSGRAYFVRPL